MKKLVRNKNTIILLLFLSLSVSKLEAKLNWFQAESKHFTILYLEQHSEIVPHVINSAETALAQLSKLFSYTPSEKIVITLDDFSDYGSAGATTVPQSYIRLGLEPLEHGYENIPYNERVQWLLNHELVHIVVNDVASGSETFARSLFSKVPPQQNQPLTVFYSLITGHGRYSPTWHHEGVAVFMETWLSGGFGRSLGNFDEMFFRAMVLENRPFPSSYRIDSREVPDSFLLNTLNYLYGARFMVFLAAAFDAEKVLAWYNSQEDNFYSSYIGKFREIFGLSFTKAWKYFIHAEKEFQKRNIAALKSAPLTPVKRITNAPMGWVTTPYIYKAGKSILFGNHQPHQLTAINLFDFGRKKVRQLGSLPTPSLIRIASTAYDSETNLFFYTTNNNGLYRDVRVLNILTKKDKLLFENMRVGDLTASANTGDLWGIQHLSGKAVLVHSPAPYRELIKVVQFDFGDILYDLAVSESGRLLAATLHQSNGEQSVIIADLEVLKRGGKFSYITISNEGSPEFPAWGPDENTVYWNAYTNGVSNIYRFDRRSGKIEPLTHTLNGLFRPAHVSSKYLFAFEFSSDGFFPVIIPNKPAEHLPAIQYFGSKAIEKNPQLINWNVWSSKEAMNGYSSGIAGKRYDGFSQMKVLSFIPVISGFQDQKVVGLYTHWADPLLTHDLIVEAGWTPYRNNSAEPVFHFKTSYTYDRKFKVEAEHNAPDFYDLFNQRKTSLNGSKYLLENTHYWKYDKPHKIKQTTSATFFTGITAINDNVIKINNPDFAVFETALNSRNIRRAIGSVDDEFGTDWTITFSGLMNRPEEPQWVGGLHAEWNGYSSWLWPHNIVHLQVSGGLLNNSDNLAIGNYYFGGFGNRGLDNKPVKQFRGVFKFPGIPIYSLDASSFTKVMFEHNLPPLRFAELRIGSHQLHYADVSWFTQGILAESNWQNEMVNIGGQINFVFKHWFNLESTLSAGVARAFYANNSSREWFISYKLLRN